MTSLEILLPIAFALTVWWSTTGLLLYLNRLPTRTYPVSMIGATFVVGIAVAFIEVSFLKATPAGAYLGFLGAVLLWGWLELGYLMGFLAGPVRTPCPPELQGWRRFIRAVAVGLYHELAIIACGVPLLILASDAVSSVAAWTFCTLWVMRWSAKLNLYFGVRNLDMELVPDRLRYLVTYMGTKPMNPLFPISVTCGSVLVVYHIVELWQTTEPGMGISAVLLATITTLGVLEHWFLVVPMRESRLWRWTLRDRAAA
ncbi:MAG: putative photosynthetic complex assembly protein PuhE [Pseudomonadota bacterium]